MFRKIQFLASVAYLAELYAPCPAVMLSWPPQTPSLATQNVLTFDEGNPLIGAPLNGSPATTTPYEHLETPGKIRR